MISIHALREEGDSAGKEHQNAGRYFYPRPPRGGRRYGDKGISSVQTISIHALREEGDETMSIKSYIADTISIHALREEGDQIVLQATDGQKYISIHALREEGDRAERFCTLEWIIFLSTPSARRATVLGEVKPVTSVISIHALREEGDGQCMRHRSACRISIHALREEGDGKNLLFRPLRFYFYPRPPRGGRLVKVMMLFAFL